MSDAAEVIAVAGTTRRLGGERDGFQLEVPRFVVRRGECVAVTGPSGCGKSTMLDLLGLVLRPDRCSTFVFSTVGGDRIDIADHWRRNDLDGLARVRARHIGYVLQTGGLLPFLSALENIVLSRSLLGLDATSALVDHLAEALSIGHLLRKKPQALSIGERQRVSIARALAHRPAVLLADEPTAALDPRQGEQVMKLLLALVRAFQTTAIIVSHDWDMIAKFGLRRVEAAQVAGGSTAAATQFSG